jgi:maleylacetoacetate isomerase
VMRMLRLYSYFRSSTSYRARIALHLKGVPFETMPVHLIHHGGEHRKPEYQAVNPQMRVPSLEILDGAARRVLIQSPAILEWLEERYPDPPLLPENPEDRADVRALCAIIGCDIHPVNNLSTLKYLKANFGADEAAINAWYGHWVHEAFAVIEQLLRPGPYAFGERPGMADIYLVPQVANARRYNLDLAAYPTIVAIDAVCRKLDAFRLAAPENQPDAG